VEAQREQLKKNIAESNNDGEKQRLMGQLDQFENAIMAQHKQDADTQNSKLQAALAKRRAKKKELQGKISDEK